VGERLLWPTVLLPLHSLQAAMGYTEIFNPVFPEPKAHRVPFISQPDISLHCKIMHRAVCLLVSRLLLVLLTAAKGKKVKSKGRQFV